jgi:hypothetical protein
MAQMEWTVGPDVEDVIDMVESLIVDRSKEIAADLIAWSNAECEANLKLKMLGRLAQQPTPSPLRNSVDDALRVLASYHPSQPSSLRRQKIDDAIGFLRIGSAA